MTTRTIFNYNRRTIPPPEQETARVDILEILSHFSPEEIGACRASLRDGTLDGDDPRACLYGVVAQVRGVEFWQMEGESVYRPGVRWMVAYIRAGRRNTQTERLEEWLQEALGWPQANS